MTDAGSMISDAGEAEPELARRGRRGISHAAALVIIFAATLALLLIYLGVGDPVDMMELFNLVPVKEAMRDGHWLMPTLNGLPRLEKPPLPVWIPAGLGVLFHTDSLWILRLGSVLMAVLASARPHMGWAASFLPAGRMVIFARKRAGEFSRSARRCLCRRCSCLTAKPGWPRMIFMPRDFSPAGRFFWWRWRQLGKRDAGTGRRGDAANEKTRNAKLETQNGLGKTLNAEPRTPNGVGESAAAFWACSILAGIATGLSVLSKGPVPAATVMLPLGLWLLLYHRRAGVWAGVAIAAVASLLTFFPWLVAIGGLPLPGGGGHWLIAPRVQNAWHVWAAEFLQFGTGEAAQPGVGTKAQLTDPFYYYLQFLYWAAPLTPCLIAGLVMPFLPARKTAAPDPAGRRAIWLFWIVTVGGLILLSVPSEKKDRYSLQLFPFAALLCAAVWREFAKLREDEPVDAGGKLVLAAQALFFIVPGICGIAIALCVAITGRFFKWPVVADAVHAMGIAQALIAFMAVAAGGIWLWRVMARRRFLLTGCGVAFNAGLLTFCCMWAYRAAPEMHTNPVRGPVEAAFANARQAGATPQDFVTAKGDKPWLATDYFAGQILPEIDAPGAAAWAQTHPGEPLCIVAVESAIDFPRNTAGPSPTDRQIAAIERATGRKSAKLAEWNDEGRLTEMLLLR